MTESSYEGISGNNLGSIPVGISEETYGRVSERGNLKSNSWKNIKVETYNEFLDS